MPRSWSSSLAAALALAALAQAPGTLLLYRVRVLEDARVLATGLVTGPLDTDLRLSLRTDTAEVEALLNVLPEGGGDSVGLSGEFFTKRRAGRTRRGLELWEQDSYRRAARLAWGDTARLYPFGAPPPPALPARSSSPAASRRSMWVEIGVTREPAGGEGRPAELVSVMDGTIEFALEAVVRPRRARVIISLVRGDTVSALRAFDLVPAAPARRVQVVLGTGPRRAFDVSLTRPEPGRSVRDRALALDADVVCLRVAQPDVAEPIGVLCGRLNNVARRLALPSGDTLVATFVWPAAR